MIVKHFLLILQFSSVLLTEAKLVPEIRNETQPPESEELESLSQDTEDNIKDWNPDFSPQLPFHTPENNIHESLAAKAVRLKIFHLVKSSKDDIDSKIVKLNNIHGAHKDNAMYKIGYIVSFINRTYDSLTNMYENIDKNREKWSPLKILRAYKEATNTKEFVSQVLRALDSVQRTKTKKRNVFTKRPRWHKNRPQAESGIAWSYYDNDMI